MRQIALGLIVTGLIATPAWAGEAGGTSLKLDGALRGVSLTAAAATPRATAQDDDEAPTVSAIVGADIPSVYFFRGYRQELDPAFTIQPYVDVAIAGQSVSFNIGSWNSIHSGSNDGFYESDFYAAATFGKVKATYTAYMYPDYDDSTIHELMLSTSFDHVLAPSVAIAFELAKPEGLDKGIYFELGVAPAVPMADDAPVSITIPVKIGLSLKDYYFNEDGDHTPFGYVSGGITLGHKVNDKVEVHGGVTIYGLNSGLKYFNVDDEDGKPVQFVASVGMSASF